MNVNIKFANRKISLTPASLALIESMLTLICLKLEIPKEEIFKETEKMINYWEKSNG